MTLKLVRVGWPPHGTCHLWLPRGALLFEGPLALRMPRDKKEAVRSEGNVKGVITLNSSVEEQLSVEFAIKDYMDILSTNQCRPVARFCVGGGAKYGSVDSRVPRSFAMVVPFVISLQSDTHQPCMQCHLKTIYAVN